MSTYNLYFEQEYEKYQNFLSENFPVLDVKFSIYLYRRVFVMQTKTQTALQIRIFVVSMKNQCIHGYPKCAN